MKKFTLDDENLVDGFFNALDISPQAIFEQALKRELPGLTEQEAQDIAENYWDKIQDEIGNSGIRYDIEAEADEETEVDEATGTWGHYLFDIRYPEKTKSYFEKELENIMQKLAANLKGDIRYAAEDWDEWE